MNWLLYIGGGYIFCWMTASIVTRIVYGNGNDWFRLCISLLLVWIWLCYRFAWILN